jgi:hypothetical protein
VVEAEDLMRAMPAVVGHVVGQDALEMPATDNQEVVGDFGPEAADRFWPTASRGSSMRPPAHPAIRLSLSPNQAPRSYPVLTRKF